MKTKVQRILIMICFTVSELLKKKYRKDKKETSIFYVQNKKMEGKYK